MADGNSNGATLETISIRISASAKGAANSIDRLTNSLSSLRSATSSSFSNLSKISSELSSLSSAISSLRNVTAPINSLSRSMGRLNEIDVGRISNSMRDLSNATSALNSIGSSVDSIREFRKGVNSLLGSLEKLRGANLSGVAESVEQVVRAIRPLTNEMIRAGSGMSNFGANLRDMVTAARGANNFNQLNQQLGQLDARITRANRSSKGFVSTFKKIASVGTVTYVFREIAQVLSRTISKSTAYIEAMNLATVSLGELADEAKAFSQNISDSLGIDQGEMLKNMGLFQNLATSFGVANDQAYILSKGMTQLAYDFASFHDLDIEESFLKFQSALAGELEPIRRVGVDISNARLQQELYDLGLKQNISTLSRADKAILTYIAIMKQSTNEMGDMARTITSPSNMLRVLGNQVTITARQIGNIFIPALQAILPWAIAVVKVVGQLAGTLASLVGFKMPDFYEGVDTNVFEGVSAGLDGVGASADAASKKMKQLIGGFDELNILQKENASAGSGAVGGSVLGDIDLSGYQYDMLEGLVPTDDLVDDIKAFIKKLIEPFNNLDFSSAVQKFSDFFKAIKNQFAQFDWGGLLSDSWTEIVELFSAVLDHIASTWLPVIEALNIPKVIFTGLTALKDAVGLLGDAVRAVTPGVAEFVERAIVPIAEWVGDKLSDAFMFLSEQFQKVSAWFGEISPKFQVLGEKAGIVVQHIWGIVEPIADAAWDGFKSVLSKIVEVVMVAVELLISLSTWVASALDAVVKFANQFGIFEQVKQIAKNVIDSTIGFINGLLDALKGTLSYATGVFSGDWNQAWEGLKQNMSGIVSAMISVLQMFFGSTAADFSKWFNGDIKVWFTPEKWRQMGRAAIDSLYNSIKSAANKIKNFFADLFNFDSLFDKYESAPNDYRTPGSVMRSSVPAFASGNVATDPTLAIFGEYPGAKHNPEVTAPQSTIYETVVAANSEMVGAVYQMAGMIVQAIEDNATEISADSKGIFKAVRKQASDFQKSHGVPAF